jgi:hypothetical protein
VVAAVLGAPLLLLYAVAWALLPDRDGRIHLQRLFEGDVQPPIVGIGVLLVLSLLPWSSGVWWFGGPFDGWGDPGWGGIVGRVVWTLVVIGAAVALIVVAARNGGVGAGRAGGPSAAAGGAAGAAGAGYPAASGSSTVSAAAPAETATTAETVTLPSDDAAATGSTVPLPSAASGDADVTAETVPLPADAAERPTLDIAAEPSAPPAPGVGASASDVTDWQARQAQWRLEHAQWKQRLDADMRAVKAQRAAELRSQAAQASAASAARRIAYRAANPRVGAGIGWLTIGLALIAGALTSALWTTITGLSGYSLTASLAAATLVIGVVVLIAGLARRRSGFLITLGIILAVLTGVSAFVPEGARVAFDPSAVTPVDANGWTLQFDDVRLHFEGN